MDEIIKAKIREYVEILCTIPQLDYNNSFKFMAKDSYYLVSKKVESGTSNKLLESEDCNRQKTEHEKLEVEKVKRKVPKWLTNPKQNNSLILDLFMRLSHNDEVSVTRDTLKSEFESKFTFPFRTNYNQMKNFGKNNNAKVFEENNLGEIHLWAPVASFIIKCYDERNIMKGEKTN